MSYSDRMIEDLQREIAELKKSRTVTLRDAKGVALIQATYPGDQRFLWTSDAALELSVASLEIA